MRKQPRKLPQPDLFGGFSEGSPGAESPEQTSQVRRVQGAKGHKIAKPWSSHNDLIPKFIESQRSKVTRLSYGGDIRYFFGGHPSPSELRAFLDLDEAQLTRRMSDYRDHMLACGLSPSTINRRLTTLRSLLRFAHARGLSRTDGRRVLKGIAPPAGTTAARDLDHEQLKDLIKAPGTATLLGLRDTAILQLLCKCPLHRSQLCNLDVADYRAKNKVLTVKIKTPQKQVQAVPVPLGASAIAALDRYLEAAGHQDQAQSPLFLNLDRRSHGAGQRLTIDGIYYLIRRYGHEAEVPWVNSRVLRRAAIQSALKAASNDATRAHERLGHISLQILLRHRKR